MELVLYPATFAGKNYIQNECGVQKVPHAQLYLQELHFKYVGSKKMIRYTMQKWIIKSMEVTVLISEKLDFRAKKIIKKKRNNNHITITPVSIKRKIREYYQQFYTHKLEELGKMAQFLKNTNCQPSLNM